MSVTVTSNPITYTLRQTLADYDTHYTGEEVSEPNARDDTIEAAPTNWTQSYRRVPAFRPTNRNLNWDERPNGSNGFERGFITIMFVGVALNAVGEFYHSQRGILLIKQTAAQLWGRTGGKIFTKVFRYGIGGEW